MERPPTQPPSSPASDRSPSLRPSPPSSPQGHRPPASRLRDLLRRRPRWLLATAAALVVALLGALAGVALAAAIHRPRVESLADFTPSLVTEVRDASGAVLATFARERRLLLEEREVPPLLRDAIVAAEDANFFQHGGIDAEGVLRAALRNLRSGEIEEGASTITMQLARQLFLTRDRTWQRKIEEAFLSVELEKSLSKQQILTLYCNLIYLGHGNYGMAAAARDYFGKDVDELTVAEAATLAGIVQQPSRFSPYRSPELVVERRDYVLRRMREEGYIGKATYVRARAEPLAPAQRAPERRPGRHFAEEVRQELESRYGTTTLLEGGLDVDATLDPRIQRAAERALRSGLVRLDHRRGWRGPVETVDLAASPDGPPPIEGNHPPTAEVWSRGLVLEAGPRTARVRFADGERELDARGIGWTRRSRPSDLLSAGDVAWFRLAAAEELEEGELAEGEEPYLVLEQEPELEGAVVVLQSSTGAVRGLVGGWDFERSKFDRAVQARRQVGSAFKPFVYGAAFEAGFTPADTLFDGPVAFPGATETDVYSPRNYYRRYYGIITLRWALEHSANVTSVKLLDLVGTDRVVDLARRCGVRSELPPYPSLALGSADMTPLELAAAYAAIANQGVWVEPYMIERVRRPDGSLVESHLPRAREAMAPEVAWVLGQVLAGVVDRGTGAKVADLEIDLAGKTGTTDRYTDAWFVGFTPRYTLLVWVGHDVKRPIGHNMTGSEAALPIWREIVVDGLESGWLVKGERFVPPPGVVTQPVEYRTGLLPAPGARRVIEESFVEGTAPIRRWQERWGQIVELPWFQQRPFYIPKEGERMPEQIPDWSAVERAWGRKGG